MDARHVRDASVNIYQGGAIFTHITGFPHVEHEAAERTATRCVNPLMYRINVRLKGNVNVG
jgi:hypothetical protein